MNPTSYGVLVALLCAFVVLGVAAQLGAVPWAMEYARRHKLLAPSPSNHPIDHDDDYKSHQEG